MRGLSRRRVDGGNVACLELAQALGDAGLHTIEQGVEVHAATLAGETFLKARDATVAALFLEQLGARGTAQRRLTALGRKVERRAGVQIQRPDDLGDLKSALAEAFEIKKDRYKYETLGKHKTCLLIFFNNSLRTRLSTQKAARNLGMDVIVLDVNQGAWKLETERGVIMDGDKSEHLLEAIPVMASYCDIIGVRSFAHFENREDDYTEKILNQFIKYSGKPVFSMEAATGHPLQAFADLITIEEYKKKDRPKVVLTWAPHPRALPQAVPNSFADWMNEADVDFVILK